MRLSVVFFSLLSVFLLSGAAPIVKQEVYKTLELSDAFVKTKGKQVKIIIIDTGFDSAHSKDVNLCPSGHKSFSGLPWDLDMHGHGTNVAGLVAKYAKADYCLVIYNYWNGGGVNAKASTLAWIAAANSDADMIVYSGGGLEPIDQEKRAVKKALRKGKIIVAAAGNESQDLNKKCNFFPACYYKRIVVVGNVSNGTLQSSSNHGDRVDFYDNGVNAKALGRVMTGTSQANAIVAGKLVAEVFKKKNIKGYKSPYLIGTKVKANVRH